MKKKKLTYNSLALGNLKNRKKQYTLLIIGIILSMTLSSRFTFFVSSAVSSALETHNVLYGKQSEIMVYTATNDEIEEFGQDVEIVCLEDTDEWVLCYGYELFEDGFKTELEAMNRLQELENQLL